MTKPVLRMLSTALLVSAIISSAAMAEEENDTAVKLEDVIVTAPKPVEPLRVESDPKSPRQPVPPGDGAGYLKNFPGISVTRKGGTGGDPVLRGMGGSRLNVLLDGQYLLGGCGGRMDPPTAYIFPESYDRITILKGPQTVLYGGGNIAGNVLFERRTKRFETPGVRGMLSFMNGSFDRNDQMADVAAGMSLGFVRLIGTKSDANDYKDGDGQRVHSFYTRESLTSILGLTPNANTRLELTTDFSRAEAAYADRTMDGSKFHREGYNLKFEKQNISDMLNKIELLTYYNYIDHVMDNFSLRTPSSARSLNNPDRKTWGGRMKTELTPSPDTTITLGVEYEEDVRTSRSGVNYKYQPRIQDMTFKKTGFFGELKQILNPENRLIGGLRTDFVDVKRDAKSNTTEQNEKNTLYAAFLRYENDLSASTTSYIGVGTAQRTADWWERNKVFFLDPERTTQTDIGVIYSKDDVRASVSLFYSKIHDFILVSTTAPTARNVDVTTLGGEADISYSPVRNWTATATAAYVRGQNNSDNTALAQIPPLEGTLGLKFDNDTFLGGVLLRAVARQNRYDTNKGNIVGTDIGTTPGFNVLSANAGYRPVEDLLVSVGVDNILNKTYAEHISKAGSSSVTAFGLGQTTRVNEPGRNFWLKVTYMF